MAKNNELKAIVTADATKFNSTMRSVGATATSTVAMATAAFTALAAGTVALGVSAIKTAAQYQDLEKRIQFLVGDIAKGTKIFEEINVRAAKSVLETQDLIDAFSALLAITGKAHGVDFLENLGFVAKGADKPLREVAERVGKLITKLGQGGSAWRETARELNAIGVISKETLAEMTKLGGGAKSLEVLMGALNAKAALGREVFGEGFSAEMAKLRGSWSLFLKQLGEGENLKAVEEGVASLRNVLEDLGQSKEFAELRKEMLKFIKSIDPKVIADLGHTLLDLMKIIVKLGTLLSDTVSKIGIASAAFLTFGGLLAAIFGKSILVTWAEVIKYLGGIGPTLTAAAGGAKIFAGALSGILVLLAKIAAAAAVAFAGFKLGGFIDKKTGLTDWLTGVNDPIHMSAPSKKRIADLIAQRKRVAENKARSMQLREESRNMAKTRLAEEANKRIIHNYTAGPPAN